MTTSVKPTAKQLRILEKFGVEAPPTRIACNNLISYILKGNGTIGDDVNQRIVLTRRYHKNWVGKKVRVPYKFHPRTGTIIYLMAKRRKDIILQAACRRKMNQLLIFVCVISVW